MPLQTLGRFMLVGGSGVVVNTLAFFVLFGVVGLPFVLASALSTELAIANNFVWNDVWTFARSRASTPARYVKFFLKFNTASLGGLVITICATWALVHVVGVHYLVANLLAIGLASFCNFAASALWTWRGG